MRTLLMTVVGCAIFSSTPLLGSATGYDAARKQYSQVIPFNRDWLTAQLANVRDRYRSPAIAIDYQCPAVFLHDVSSRKLQSNA